MTDTNNYKPGCCIDRSCSAATCMRLPEGATCGACQHFDRCHMLFPSRATAAARICDFYPRRFRAVVQEGR